MDWDAASKTLNAANKAAEFARTRAAALGFGARQNEALRVYIAETLTPEADYAELAPARIQADVDAIQRRLADPGPSTETRPPVTEGEDVRTQAGAQVLEFFAADKTTSEGVDGFRQMCQAYIETRGIRSETPDGPKPINLDTEATSRVLAMAGAIKNRFNYESRQGEAREKQRFGGRAQMPYIKDRGARLQACTDYVTGQLRQGFLTSPFSSGPGLSGLDPSVRASVLTTVELANSVADAINKMEAPEYPTESTGGESEQNPSIDLLVDGYENVSDYRTSKIITSEHFGTFSTMNTEGDTIPDIGIIGDTQETVSADLFGGKVALTDHLKRNSDINYLDIVPRRLKQSYKRTIRRTVMNVPLNNPNMRDGSPVWGAGRGNFNGNAYSFAELLSSGELALLLTAASQGAGAEVEHMQMMVRAVLCSVGALFAIAQDTTLDTDPTTASRSANAWLRIFGRAGLYSYAPWDTAGTTDLILLICAPFIRMAVLDGIREGQIFMQDDPAILLSLSTLFMLVGGHGVAATTHRTSVRF